MKIIDLSYPIQSGMPRFDAPWHPETSVRPLGHIAEVGRNTSQLNLGTHCGTHIDAARHFIPDGETIDQLPLEKLIGKVSIIDLSSLPFDHEVTPDDLAGIRLSARLLLRYDWSKYWGDPQFYHHYPYLGQAAARYLIDQGVRVLGMDTPSPDDSRIPLLSEEDSPLHKLLLGNGVTLIEYLTNLDKADLHTAYNLVALPLPVREGDGAPARVCLIPQHEEREL
jgi:arylformamidase